MSHYQGDQYQRPPLLPPRAPPPPNQGYHDQYRQPGHSSPQGQNGSYSYQQAQVQYPGQHTPDNYGVGGGPVQQPQVGSQQGFGSPRSSSSYGGAHITQQQLYQPPTTYNPSHYAPQQQQQQPQSTLTIPAYNPQAYASTNTAPYPGQYNPAAYPEASSHSTSGPVDPFAYSPGPYSGSTYSPQQSQLGQSPQMSPGQFSPHQQYSPHPSNRQYSYARSSTTTSPQPSHGFQSPQSAYSYQQNAPYPSQEYRPYPQGNIPMQIPEQQYGGTSPGPTGLQDDTWIPSPPNMPAVDSRQSPSPLYQSTSHSTLPSPPSTSPGPTPPAHHFVSRSNTLDQHPQQRPLPGPPGSDEDRRDYFHSNGGHQMSHADMEAFSQEELFSQVENAVMNAGSSTTSTRSPSISISQAPYASGNAAIAPFATGPHRDSRRMQRNGSIVNGHLSPASQEHSAGEQLSDESDAEAAQGLAMMRAAEEDDVRRRSSGGQTRFSGLGSQGGSQRSTHAMRSQQVAGSDSDDYGTVDMSSFGGGYDVRMTYGGDPNQLAAGGEINGETYSQPVSSQNSSMRRSHASQSSQFSRGDYDYNMGSIHPFRPFNSAARVDAVGTGGLSEPSGDGRRQSYDEGDEYALMEGQLPERFPDEPPDVVFQAAATSFTPGRPLPPPPATYMPPLHTDMKGPQSPHGPSPYAPDAYTGYNAQGQLVPRSTSLLNHSNTPQVVQPLRSKTDAEERRLKQQQYRSSMYTTFESTPASSVVPDLPSLGAKRFVPSKLGAPDFKKCDEPWSLMSILKWLLTTINPEQYTELKEAEINEALVNLFTNKVPTMNIADAEGLSNRVVADMYQAGTLVTTEEWVRIVPGPISGVIYQLTGSGCYSGTLHDHIVPGRCYSHFCQRTLKKVNLQAQSIKGSDSWIEFHGLQKEDLDGKDKRDIERQMNLHEIVYTEDVYMDQLIVLRSLYRDALASSDPSIISPKRRDKFIREVFGRVDAVIQANEDHLRPQLKYRQQEQGPWVVGFSDIFRQWIRKAKAAYLEYAGGFPAANFMVRQEIDRNLEFRNFIERVSKDKRSNRLQWDTFLKAPITRLQRYSLLLATVLKNMKTDSEERRNLQIALEEVKTVTQDCDARVAEMTRKIDLTDLSMKLVLRPGMQNAVELNLDHFGRELIHRGDLQRMGGNRFTWLDSHALLFDHYLVIAKTVAQSSEQGGKLEKYDVSRLPIPMDLLILESTNDPAVQKSSYMKGITSVTTVSGRTSSPADPSVVGRTPSTQSAAPGGLQHVNTGASTNSLQTVSSLGDARDSDKIMYPFKVKHLGRDTYTLFAPSDSARREWCFKITEAKTKHAAALYAQHAEPFRLRVMADSAFVFDAFAQGKSGAPLIKGTPVDRAIKEVEHRFKDTGRPGPICRARVNCATTFTTPYPEKQMVAVGTDFGVFISEIDNPRGWTKAIPMARVTQVAVLEDFNLFLFISDKSLIAYHLDIMCPSPTSAAPTTNDSSRKAPQKLSGSKDVGFFVTGRMKDRSLVFYKKRENLASVFKVLEPIYQKSTEKKRGLFKRGATEFFREYDEFYIPAECTGMNLFHSSLAVSTARGFEVLTLDKKQPWSVPELHAEHVQNIASHIKDQKALGMLRLSEQEFLLVYSNCAVYVNKHGDVSRSVIMDFVGTAQSAALYGAYLILFDSDFVEIRNASNGRLKQIIAGREIKCLDDGGCWTSAASGPNGKEAGSTNGPSVAGSRTVKLVMQHPEAEKTQIVVELLLNENLKDG